MYTSGTIKLLWEELYSRFLNKLTEEKVLRAPDDAPDVSKEVSPDKSCNDCDHCGCDVEKEKD